MKNINVKRLNASHEKPEDFIANVVDITFSKKLNKNEDIAHEINNREGNLNTLENVMKMKHTGIIEHVNLSYLIEGASRSFLAQMTRHRLFSFTSASQHYIDYSDFGDFVMPVEMENAYEDRQIEYLKSNKRALEDYRDLINKGIKHEVARQVLPNSMRNNLIVTGNLRQWVSFLNLRLCNRNTSEIQYVAYLIKKDLENYIPTIINYAGPDCTLEQCTQEHMYCGEEYTDNQMEEKFVKVLKKK